MRLAVLLLLAGCTAAVRTEHPNDLRPAHISHPECAHEYNARGDCVAAYCPDPTGYR